MPDISRARILIIATDGFEDSELLDPRRTLIDWDADVTLASIKKGEIKGDKGKAANVDITFDDVHASDYDALLIPGGTKNPDKLRMDEKAVGLVKKFMDAGKPVGAICHGPWLLVEADVVRGRTVTSWPSIRTDLRNAGANVVDQEAAVDSNLVTSRKPEDIPAFTEAFIQLVEKVEAKMPAE
ncbi:type 1 glutamine amidotransferase domain-containing protein [Allosphingosinicella vermicomposti]|uniref:type 1 glutamine amidotransferase domain-containing protein n=1 Tax=Allosphingosinicella vermicomposti TaxID=614671 RepID=UPI000D0FC59C|nr:type 1 glutamine amidotransferase domain-containing protein [Allosphingosinicella vermicomposti]